jgi:hypothetical protein
MNGKMHLNILGFVLRIIALFMIPAWAISVYEKEFSAIIGFLATIVLMLMISIP